MPFVPGADSTVWTGTNVQKVSANLYLFRPSASGDFRLRVFAYSGTCSSTDSVLAAVRNKPSYTVRTTNETACAALDGAAEVIGLGDTTQYIVSWPTLGRSTFRVTGLRAGLYSVTVTNRLTGCDTSIAFSIVAPSTFSAQIVGVNSLTCSGTTIFPVGRPAGGTFTVVGRPDLTPPFSSISAGSYTLIYNVDSAGCNGLDTVNFRVKGLPTPAITPSGLISICAGRSQTFTIPTVGTASYQWFKSPRGAIPGANSASFTTDSAGTYTVSVTDSGCTGVSTAVILEVLPQPTSSVLLGSGTASPCVGSTATLISNGGGTFLKWQEFTSGDVVGAGQSLIINSSGRYRAIRTNGACTDTSAYFDVTFQPTPLADIVPSGSTSFCAGSSVTLAPAATPGLTVRYVWRNLRGDSVANGATFVVDSTGGFTLDVITAAGCRSTSTVTTTQRTDRPNTSLDVIGDITFCQGSSVTLRAASGTGYTYFWRGPNGLTGNPIVVSTSGTYRAIITVAGGCIDSTRAVVVTVNPLPTVTVSPLGPITLCQNDVQTLTATPTATATYQWFSGSSPITGASAPDFTIPSTVEGDFNYSISVSLGSCSARSLPITVRVNPRPQAFSSALGALKICQNESVFLIGNTPIAPITGNWLRSDTIINVTNPFSAREPGTYVWSLTLNGCVGKSDAIIITQPVRPSNISAGDDKTICVTTPATAIVGYTPTIGAGVSWSGAGIVSGTDVFDPAQAGIGPKAVVLTVTSDGCNFTDSATYTVIPGFTASVDPAAVTICAQTSTVLGNIINQPVANVRYTYQWQKDGRDIVGATDSLLTVTEGGSYTTVISAGGCSTTSQPSVVTVRAFEAVNAGPNRSACLGDAEFILSGSPAGGAWSGSKRVSSIGIYRPDSVVVEELTYTTNQNGCVIIDKILVFVNARPAPDATYFSEVTGIERASIDITDKVKLVGTGTGTFAWTPAAGVENANAATAFATPFVTTLYRVTVTTDSGCSASDTVTVKVRTDVRVANAFSPNNDGKNDTWNIYNIQAYPNADIKVFNRWGAAVYDKVGYGTPWDGTNGKGDKLPLGAYYYVIDLNNNTKPFIGDVTLVR